MQLVFKAHITFLLSVIDSLTKKLTDTQKNMDLAWASGFIDGEGCITAVNQIYKPVNGKQRKPTTRLKLMVSQNCWSTINKLKEILGEKSYLTEAPMQEEHNYQVYVLHFDGRHALNAINKVKPFLRRKKQRAIMANVLWQKGQLGKHPGRKGLTPELVKIREHYVKRLRKVH